MSTMSKPEGLWHPLPYEEMGLGFDTMLTTGYIYTSALKAAHLTKQGSLVECGSRFPGSGQPPVGFASVSHVDLQRGSLRAELDSDGSFTGSLTGTWKRRGGSLLSTGITRRPSLAGDWPIVGNTTFRASETTPGAATTGLMELTGGKLLAGAGASVGARGLSIGGEVKLDTAGAYSKLARGLGRMVPEETELAATPPLPLLHGYSVGIEYTPVTPSTTTATGKPDFTASLRMESRLSRLLASYATPLSARTVLGSQFALSNSQAEGSPLRTLTMAVEHHHDSHTTFGAKADTLGMAAANIQRRSATLGTTVGAAASWNYLQTPLALDKFGLQIALGDA